MYTKQSCCKCSTPVIIDATDFLMNLDIEVLCDECRFDENNQDPDLGGTGHGDISHSDADNGL